MRFAALSVLNSPSKDVTMYFQKDGDIRKKNVLDKTLKNPHFSKVNKSQLVQEQASALNTIKTNNATTRNPTKLILTCKKKSVCR